MDVYIMTDQPETCRKCGIRVELVGDLDERTMQQRVKCPRCSYRYIVEDGDPDARTDAAAALRALLEIVAEDHPEWFTPDPATGVVEPGTVPTCILEAERLADQWDGGNKDENNR